MSILTTEEAVRSLLSKGVGVTAIARNLGISRRTVYRYKDRASVQKTTVVNDLTDPSEIKDFIDQLAPINIQGAEVINSRGDRNPRYDLLNQDYVIVLGDTHFGSECERTINIFYQVLEDLKPGTVILNGDTVDLLAVSKYPKDVRYEVSLIQERVAYHKFLKQIRDILGPDAKIIETNANHSGDGIEGRWWRYLSDRLGPVASMPDVITSLGYKNVFVPEWANVELVDDVELCNGNLHIMHGDVVRKQGGQSARGMMDKWYTSIIMNHTHRLGMTAQRIPGLGSRKERTLFAYENGCACSLKPTYATAANWQNGFSILKIDGDKYGIEQVFVDMGGAVVNTLGTVFK